MDDSHGQHDHDDHHGHRHQQGDHGHDSHHIHFDTAEAAARAELEAEVLIGLKTDIAELVAATAAHHTIDIRRIADLGPGPGVGTCLLAQHFPGADVVAVDGSATMLDATERRARRLGLGHRVSTLRLDLDDDFVPIGSVDLVWVSMALHHVGDEGAALRRIAEVVRPGGLLALIEGAKPLTITVPGTEARHPGLADRLDAASRAWFAQMRASLPGATVTDDYPSLLAAAGFDVLADRIVDTGVGPDLDDTALRYATEHLTRDVERLRLEADPADLAALDDQLRRIAEDADVRRGTTIQASRHVFVARRPA